MGNQRGSGLIIAILLTLIITAIAVGLLIVSSTNHNISANERDAERALFAAKAGLNYGYLLFEQGALIPTAAGVPFNSFAPSVTTPLDGESFTGKIYDISAAMAQGQLYKIESTGFFNRARRHSARERSSDALRVQRIGQHRKVVIQQAGINLAPDFQQMTSRSVAEISFAAVVVRAAVIRSQRVRRIIRAPIGL